ncbi:hypothetical protein BDU57DRAFT_295573 [Ampelomyces quisqualis]|uniref:Uncharacterized protein n=1 Tax=Ampelomyces quisqualis TaxID=50730 RepID=A0A6A5QFL5_AMPQU|nr:hypothetical protein BDU57DRAFT_295573 [Ampelomyces quisqualis]
MQVGRDVRLLAGLNTMSSRTARSKHVAVRHSRWSQSEIFLPVSFPVSVSSFLMLMCGAVECRCSAGTKVKPPSGKGINLLPFSSSTRRHSTRRSHSSTLPNICISGPPIVDTEILVAHTALLGFCCGFAAVRVQRRDFLLPKSRAPYLTSFDNRIAARIAYTRCCIIAWI